MSELKVQCCCLGNADDLIAKEKTFQSVDRKKPICRYCVISQCIGLCEGFGKPRIPDWMRWLTRNDPTHWRNIFAFHKTAESELGALVSEIENERSD